MTDVRTILIAILIGTGLSCSSMMHPGETGSGTGGKNIDTGENTSQYSVPGIRGNDEPLPLDSPLPPATTSQAGAPEQKQ